MSESERSRWMHLAAAMTVLAGLGVGGCAGESNGTGPRPAITEPTALLGSAVVEYKKGQEHAPHQIAALEGQVVFIAVASDTSGRLALEGDDSLGQRVRAGVVSSVVMNANRTGSFDLILSHAGNETVLATVVVK